jgi:glycosyltransferase involved in cell wall biosynthesis
MREGRFPRRYEQDRALIAGSGLFDAAWYAEHNLDLLGGDLLDHYLAHGGREGRAPSPNFDGGWYLHNYQDVAQAQENPLVHYLRYGNREGRLPGLSQGNLQTIRSALDDLRDIEPDIASDVRLERPDRLPISQCFIKTSLYSAWDNVFSAIQKSYDHLIFIPEFARDDSALSAANAALSIIAEHGDHSVLVVATDRGSKESLAWFADTTDHIVISDYAAELSQDELVRIVEMLIFVMMPRGVLNINSRACWDAIRRRGKALSNFSRIYAILSGHDYYNDGRPRGFVHTHFRSCIANLTRVYTDHQTIIRFLASEFALPKGLRSRLTFVPQPVLSGISQRSFVQNLDSVRMPVLWAERICRENNVDLLISLIKCAPWVHFDVYGGGEYDYLKALRILSNAASNLSLMGDVYSVTALPTEHYAAFLFTSCWEGLPQTLINVAARGIPVIAPAVGGIAELVNDETGWLIQGNMDSDGYLSALRDIWTRPQEAERRVGNMVARVREYHSWAAYSTAAKLAPSFLE